MSDKLNIIILAAGKGTRMKSKKLKVLHPLAGATIIDHILQTSQQLSPQKTIMVYGHQGQQLKSHLNHENIQWVEQINPQGTGHAVKVAMPYVDIDAKVLVLVGDAPLIKATDLKKLLKYSCALITAQVQNPFGYGRIIKNTEGLVEAIIEEKDATQSQKQVKEINSGIIMAEAKNLNKWLAQINTNNAQGELYLTDVPAIAHADGHSFNTVQVSDSNSIKGINDRVQLAQCETIMQVELTKQLMIQGVHMSDPSTIHIRGKVDCGQDISIDVGVILEGNNKIADNVSIGAYCIIKNCTLGKGTRIAAHSMLEDVITQGDCDIGPYARLRPGTIIGTKAKVGNFVETKKTTIGYNSKASHLTYLGDCEIGDNVNIGAGTITCNYDGVNKFKTIIEDDVFIGSDSQLIAPVTVKKGATIGAGTTLSKDAEAGQLTLSRAPQKTIKGWKKPQ
ncbi:MAG: bifunctional UDP-N-acetylglucosamine diphosphorylase/glucosamine-1-phosphate N-acetyltransferase GlmU [Alcanivoracaceae bacterium]|nr:bifunctional UDP-N-acetylglucosamine diphosphorylase/glucosamine-1-phosphate N-acetyltransferase GlmU [Alcanivoracaceae bacterium]